jgi:ABC-type branched-subunit amino acid transport system permease subunit
VTRVLAFVVSAICAGLAGSLLAIVTSLVAPGAFTLTLSIALLTAAVIGGLDSPVGAVTGGLLLGLALSYAGGYLPSGANLVPVVALGILVVVLMVRPDGLFSATKVRQV